MPEQEQQLDEHHPGVTASPKFRQLLDAYARRFISLGGMGVIVTLLLLFVFLVYEVVPLFRAADIEQTAIFRAAASSNEAPLLLAMEEQAEVGLRISGEGVATFFSLVSGEIIAEENLLAGTESPITSFSNAAEDSATFAMGFANGQILIGSHEYVADFSQADNQRRIIPEITYPLGSQMLPLLFDGPVSTITVARRDNSLIIVGSGESGEIRAFRATRESNLFDNFVPASQRQYRQEFFDLPAPQDGVRSLHLDGDQRMLLVLTDSGRLLGLELSAVFSGTVPSYSTLYDFSASQSIPQRLQFLLGGVSLLTVEADGAVNQWFLTNRQGEPGLGLVRRFPGNGDAVVDIAIEQRRKNFVVADASGSVRAFNTTANRTIFEENLGAQSPLAIAVAPRGNALLLETAPGEFSFWRVDIAHPEVSWSALWERIWYEGYEEADFVWQSSASTNAFEPKYSLVPLSFGTLKAAFYAMLLAAPLAICGAVYTGYFMAPTMRRKVKPLIELMEALPTVVLGFLAGLWLAPFVENNLLGVFSVLILLPVCVVLTSLIWFLLPGRIRNLVPSGWEAAVLLPVVVVTVWLSIAMAAPLEVLLFGSDLRAWLSEEMGIGYDQRNAMVVGFAMGFAVIPTIFSIAEDAIFTVPRHLSDGSLALGATPWQSLYRVILPTASPGIFSALMIGLGRAVGETMIVLMATGNTPIMDINIFEGMRTLAANIAIEVPESEVNSTHYRILFLAALVLFLFTFVINTVAEVVRQQLRSRYRVL